jgi:hypothetical protein
MNIGMVTSRKSLDVDQATSPSARVSGIDE